jgi:MFS family permease
MPNPATFCSALRHAQYAGCERRLPPDNASLVLFGVLFTIILAGLDNTIASTVIPVGLPELGGAQLYAWTFAAYVVAAAVSMPICGPGSDRWGRRRTYLVGMTR